MRPAKNGFGVAGISISGEAVKIARKRAKDAGAKARFSVGNAYGLKFGGKTVGFMFERGCFLQEKVP